MTTKMMTRMKTRTTRHHWRRKQSLSRNNGNCLWSVPVEKTGLHPSPLQNPQQSSGLVNDWSGSASTLDSAHQVPIRWSRRRGTVRLGEGLKPLSSPAWTTHCPFLREGNGNKKPTGQGFCKWNSGLTGQLLQSEYAFSDHV